LWVDWGWYAERGICSLIKRAFADYFGRNWIELLCVCVLGVFLWNSRHLRRLLISGITLFLGYMQLPADQYRQKLRPISEKHVQVSKTIKDQHRMALKAKDSQKLIARNYGAPLHAFFLPPTRLSRSMKIPSKTMARGEARVMQSEIKSYLYQSKAAAYSREADLAANKKAIECENNIGPWSRWR
jgi:hypothetical protein